MEARFIDGPIGGQRRQIAVALPEYRVPLFETVSPPTGDSSIPPYQMCARYILWDNWPVRYLFDCIERV